MGGLGEVVVIIVFGGDTDAGATRADAFDEDAGADLFLEGFDVADEAELDAFAFLEAGQGFHDDLEGVGVEGTEAFVEEEGFDGEGDARAVSEAKGEGEGDDKGLAAGEGGDGADVFGLVVVFDGELEGGFVVAFGDAGEGVAVGEFVEPDVGVFDEDLEGDALCKVAEGFAVASADEFVEFGPVLVFFA